MNTPIEAACWGAVSFVALVGVPAGFTMGVLCTGLAVAAGRWVFRFDRRRDQ